MISPLSIPTGVDSICIEYSGEEYISYPCGASAGSYFHVLSTDVTTEITNVDYGQFTTDMVVNVDPTLYIVDDLHNAYFKVLSYTSTGTARPTRI